MYITPFEQSFLNDYTEQAVDVMHMIYPQLTKTELSYAVRQSVVDRIQDPPVTIDNSYKHVEVDMTLLKLIDYVRERGIIMTTQGVMFSNHAKSSNPIATMLIGFLTNRKKLKKEMFRHPKGSELFQKYNLLQLLAKIKYCLPIKQFIGITSLIAGKSLGGI